MKASAFGTTTGSGTVDTITISSITGGTYAEIVFTSGSGTIYGTYATGSATAATPNSTTPVSGSWILCANRPVHIAELGTSCTTLQVKLVSATASLGYAIHVY